MSIIIFLLALSISLMKPVVRVQAQTTLTTEYGTSGTTEKTENEDSEKKEEEEEILDDPEDLDGDGLSSIAGTSYGEDLVMSIGAVGKGLSGLDPTQTLDLVKPQKSTYGQVLSSSTGMYGLAFAGDGVPEATTAIQMTIDSLYVPLENLTPGILAHNQSEIVVNSNIPTGYSLYVAEDMLLHLQQSEIRLTTVNLKEHPRELIYGTDGDNNVCAGEADETKCRYDTTVTGDTWKNQDVAGFGYTVSGDDAVAAFGGGSLYKNFANLEDDEPAQLIAGKEETTQTLTNRITTVRYQAGARTDNEAGLYHNYINYTLVPNY